MNLNNPKDVKRFAEAIELGAKIDEANRRRIRRSIYLQKEAFCHMRYECESCKDVVSIWNSRDGVTPYVTRCLGCGGEMKHIAWEKDRKDMNYTPLPEDLVWITLTKEVARVIAVNRVRQAVGKVEYSPAEESAEWVELIDGLTDSIYDNGTQPFLIKWL